MNYRQNSGNLSRIEIKAIKRSEAELRNEIYQALPESEKKKRNPKKFEEKDEQANN